MPTVQEQATTALTGPLPGSLNLVNIDASAAATLSARLAGLTLLRADMPAADLALALATAIHQCYCQRTSPHAPSEDDMRLARAILPIVQRAICNT